MTQDAVETRPASEAVGKLSQLVLREVARDIEDLSRLALRDAGLDPKDGWRYNPTTATYAREATKPALVQES